MGFLSWLTGRDEKEQDVYANYERVDDLVANLKKVSTDNVTAANDAVKAAVTELNNVNGMAQFVGQVSADCFAPTFERVASTIDQIGTLVQQKADNIKTYEESAWYEKLGSTLAMTGAKLGEGILSVVEDLGDGVVSLVGWVAPKDSGVEKWCSEFVQKEWSHDAFNFYYDSEFAKKSAFTEDSGLAGGVKLVGTVAAYCFGGGLVAGAGTAAVGTAKAGSMVAKVAGAASKVASASTWGAAVLAGVAGMGSGTEQGLLEGKSFDEAAWSGAKQGVVQAGLAFAGGKLGEKISKVTAVKGATKAANQAAKTAANATDDLVRAAANSTDDVIRTAGQVVTDATDDLVRAAANSSDDVLKAASKAVTNATDDLAKAVASGSDDAIKAAQKAVANATDDLVKAAANSTDEVLKAAGTNVTSLTDDFVKAAANSTDDAIKAAGKQVTQLADDAANRATDLATQQGKRLSDFQGYDDALSRAGRDVGQKATQNVIQQGLVKGTVTNVKAVANAGLTAGKTAVNTGINAGKTAINAVTHPVQTIKTIGTSAVNAAKAAPGAIVNGVKAAPGAIVTTAKTVGSAALHNPGVIAQGANAMYNNGQAANNIAGFDTPNVDVMGPTGQEVADGFTEASGIDFRVEDPGITDPGTTNPGTPDPGYTDPGYTGPGYTGPGYTGPGTTDPGTTVPGTTVPGTTDPGTTDPGTTNPGYTGPGYTGPSDGIDGTDGTHTGSGFGGDDEFNGPAFEIGEGFGDEGDEFDSLADIIANGDKLTEIPQSSTPIKANSNGGASAVIPIAAGLSAAAAAGIGAKVFMDKKNNADNGEDDEFDTDDWSEDGQIEIDYDESEGSIADQYLNDEDDYGYQADTGEKYGARSSEELADLQ